MMVIAIADSGGALTATSGGAVGKTAKIELMIEFVT